MSSLFQELKRRNVFRVAIAYVAIAWLVLQVADVVLGNIAAPAWLFQALLLFILIGFPLAILFAWAYELTPEGIKREREVDRSQSTTRETGQKLNRAITGILVLAVAFLLVDKFWLQDTVPAPTETDRSVAVLPFIAMSRGPDDEYFADGLTEEILNSLTRVPELLVTARTSAFHFKGRDVPIPEIANQLGVDHIVEGSVRRDGNRLRVTAQLIRAADGFHLWSENYDRDAQDTFAVQTDIAEKIAGALDIFLDEDRRSLMQESGLRSPEAFIAYQKAFELYQQGHEQSDTAAGLVAANEQLDKVIELAPGFFTAHLMAADRYSHMLLDETEATPTSDEQRQALLEAINKHLDNAIRSAPDEASRLAATYDKLVINGDWENVRSIFDRIVALDSCHWPQWYDIPNLSLGNADGVLTLSSKIAECNPIEFHGWAAASWANSWLGNYDAAVEIAQRGLELMHHDLIASAMVTGHLGAKQYDAAKLAADTVVQSPERREETLRVIDIARGQADPAAEKARISAAVDDNDRNRIIKFARIGEREEANRIAAAVDQRRTGHMTLLLAAHSCRCGAPWDIEVTPEFKRRIENADLSWPPASPVDWQLKDW